MVNVTELRPGNYFEEDGALYQVLDILLNVSFSNILTNS